MNKYKVKGMKPAKSQIVGFMLRHSDGDSEYYEPALEPEDIAAIFRILDKYGDDNESIRGELVVVDE